MRRPGESVFETSLSIAVIAECSRTVWRYSVGRSHLRRKWLSLRAIWSSSPICRLICMTCSRTARLNRSESPICSLKFRVRTNQANVLLLVLVFIMHESKRVARKQLHWKQRNNGKEKLMKICAAMSHFELKKKTTQHFHITLCAVEAIQEGQQIQLQESREKGLQHHH